MTRLGVCCSPDPSLFLLACTALASVRASKMRAAEWSAHRFDCRMTRRSGGYVLGTADARCTPLGWGVECTSLYV
jgi:hypothetical protein